MMTKCHNKKMMACINIFIIFATLTIIDLRYEETLYNRNGDKHVAVFSTG